MLAISPGCFECRVEIAYDEESCRDWKLNGRFIHSCMALAFGVPLVSGAIIYRDGEIKIAQSIEWARNYAPVVEMPHLKHWTCVKLDILDQAGAAMSMAFTAVPRRHQSLVKMNRQNDRNCATD